MKIFSLLTCLLIGISFWSCSKDENPTPTQLTKTDNISTGSWIYESGGVDIDKNGTVEIPGSAILGGCVLDNRASFKRDNTGITDEGATKCNTGDPQTAPFNWNFADAEANLVISNNIFTLLNGKFKIVTLSATNFSLTKDTLIPLISQQPVALLVNFKH